MIYQSIILPITYILISFKTHYSPNRNTTKTNSTGASNSGSSFILCERFLFEFNLTIRCIYMESIISKPIMNVHRLCNLIEELVIHYNCIRQFIVIWTGEKNYDDVTRKKFASDSISDNSANVFEENK